MYETSNINIEKIYLVYHFSQSMKKEEQLFIIRLIKELVKNELNDGISVSFDENEKGSDMVQVSLKNSHKLVKQYMKDYDVINKDNLPRHVKNSLKIKEQLIKYNLVCKGLQEYYSSGA